MLNNVTLPKFDSKPYLDNKEKFMAVIKSLDTLNKALVPYYNQLTKYDSTQYIVAIDVLAASQGPLKDLVTALENAKNVEILQEKNDIENWLKSITEITETIDPLLNTQEETQSLLALLNKYWKLFIAFILACCHLEYRDNSVDLVLHNTINLIANINMHVEQLLASLQDYVKSQIELMQQFYEPLPFLYSKLQEANENLQAFLIIDDALIADTKKYILTYEAIDIQLLNMQSKVLNYLKKALIKEISQELTDDAVVTDDALVTKLYKELTKLYKELKNVAQKKTCKPSQINSKESFNIKACSLNPLLYTRSEKQKQVIDKISKEKLMEVTQHGAIDNYIDGKALAVSLTKLLNLASQGSQVIKIKKSRQEIIDSIDVIKKYKSKEYSGIGHVLQQLTNSVSSDNVYIEFIKFFEKLQEIKLNELKNAVSYYPRSSIAGVGVTLEQPLQAFNRIEFPIRNCQVISLERGLFVVKKSCLNANSEPSSVNTPATDSNNILNSDHVENIYQSYEKAEQVRGSIANFLRLLTNLINDEEYLVRACNIIILRNLLFDDRFTDEAAEYASRCNTIQNLDGYATFAFSLVAATRQLAALLQLLGYQPNTVKDFDKDTFSRNNLEQIEKYLANDSPRATIFDQKYHNFLNSGTIETVLTQMDKEIKLRKKSAIVHEKIEFHHDKLQNVIQDTIQDTIQKSVTLLKSL